MHYRMLEEGLISSMQYFHRIVYQAVFDLKANSTNPQAYFRQRIFEDLDDYIFYMFRLYQATQARMNEGLSNTIKIRIFILISLSAVAIALLALALVFLLCRAKK